jgi:F0F1-type ATP synthase membrane subunit a
LPIAVLNLYFGLFSGYIQTLVFASLNGVWIGTEMPEDRAMGIASQATRSQKE